MADSKINQLARNTFFLYFRMILVLAVTLYTSRVVLKVLGFEDFGLYNLVGGVVVFFSFLKSALTNATYRYLAFSLGENNIKELKEVYSMAINCHIILAVVLWLLMELVGVWFLNSYLDIPEGRVVAANWVFQLSLLTFCFGVVLTPFHSNIIAHERMNFYALISIVEVILKLAIVCLLVYSPIDKLIAYASLLLITSVVILGAYICYCKREFKDVDYIRFWDKKWVYKFMSYSGWSLFVNGADVCIQQSFSVFFNWFVGVVGNAALGLSNQVNSGINMFVANFSQAFNPQIVKSYAAKDYAYFMKLIFSMSKISYILYFMIAVPILVNIEYILDIWLGEYPDLTPQLVKVTMLYYLFDSFQIPLWQGVHATGNIKTHQIMVGCIKLLSIPLSYAIFRFYGSPIWAMVAWAFLNGICAIARTIYVHFLYGLDLMRYFKEVCLKIILLTAVVFVLIMVISNIFKQNFVGVVSSSAILILITGVMSIFIVLNKSERTYLKSLPIINRFL